MAEMVPEQIVRPASPIAGRADILPPLDDEATFHQTERLLSRGDPMVFLQEPISLAFLVISALLLLVVAAPAIRKKREEALQE